MAKRVVAMVICSNCIHEYVKKETYVVAKKSYRGNPENNDEYHTQYCVKCLKDKDSYLRIVSSPVETKKK